MWTWWTKTISIFINHDLFFKLQDIFTKNPSQNILQPIPAGICSPSSTCQAWSCDPGFLLHINVVSVGVGLQGERDVMGIMGSLTWQTACHIPQPASQPSFTWWHAIIHADAAGTRDWCLCVCQWMCCDWSCESLSSTLWSCCKDEYIYITKLALGGKSPLSGVTLELTHFLSLSLCFWITQTAGSTY